MAWVNNQIRAVWAITGQFTSDGQHLITLPLTFHTLIFLIMKLKYVAHDIVAYIFIKMANNNWSHGKKDN
jgi:hypothetical protein